MAAAVRVAAAVAAVFWAVFFFGLIDLSVIAAPGDFAPVVALEASWAVLFTFFAAGAFVAVAYRPRATVPAAAQLLVVAFALLLSSPLGLTTGPLPVALAMVVLAGLVLIPNTEPLRKALRWDPYWPFVLVAAAGGPCWLWHAGDAFDNSRSPTGNADVTRGIDHWPVHGATAVTLAVAAVLASVWPRGRRLLGGTTCMAGAVLGAASLAYPSSAGALPNATWSLAAIMWSVTVGLLTGAGQSRRDVSTGSGA